MELANASIMSLISMCISLWTWSSVKEVSLSSLMVDLRAVFTRLRSLRISPKSMMYPAKCKEFSKAYRCWDNSMKQGISIFYRLNVDGKYPLFGSVHVVCMHSDDVCVVVFG